MELYDKLRPLAERIPSLKDHVQTEEATKNAFIMPFLGALGYNVFDPTEVVPEFTADLGTKKGEKVDYAIMRDGKPIILIECKASNAKLGDAHHSQLHRYFAVVEARVAILTNGIDWKFYSDIDKPNVMDSKPFLEINMLDLQEQQVEGLQRLTRENFNLDEVVGAASRLKYNNAIQRVLEAQFKEPDEEFVRFFVSRIYDGRYTAQIKERFTPIVQQALQHFVSAQLATRLKSAFNQDVQIADLTASPSPAPQEDEAEPEPERDSGIETTVEEMEAFYIVKAILREIVDPKRVVMRDRKSYCGIILDNNGRKPLARLHFNRTQKYVGVFDAEKNEERMPIEDLNDIFALADRIQAAVAFYDSPAVPAEE